MIKFFRHNVIHSNFSTIGIPLIDVHPTGKCIIGSNLVMVNNARYATLGKVNRCKITVYSKAKLVIGNNVGMSNVTIVATKDIILGNRVMIGAGVTIIDSDFHSMNSQHWFTKEDELYMKSLPVKIGNNVFIGMNSIILKGVLIGDDVRIVAGSVVTTNIPNNEVWGGNPAKFIKKLE
jgi:acetyltransferase-like isoleucine patch superfamily enzyme